MVTLHQIEPNRVLNPLLDRAVEFQVTLLQIEANTVPSDLASA